MTERVLVTGAGGMIGRAVVDELVAQGIGVTALDRVEADGLPADRMLIGDVGDPWAAEILHPAYVPVDEDLPLQIEDPYGLSKQVDEATALMITRRYGLTVIALRLPFIADARRRRDRLAATTADPLIGSAEMWAYLDLRDAARALRLSLTVPASGFHAVLVAAPETLAPYPTDDLLARYHPSVPVRRALPGRAVPLDLSRARDLLGFTAEHQVELDLRPLPVDLTRAAG